LFSHPVLVVIISRLFQLFLHSQYIPSSFKRSYIVPIPKPKDTRTKAMMCDDYRGIAITPILCKVFEYCFLDRFHTLLLTGDNQFGFKKGIGCTHAIYSCRNIVDHFVNSGSTVHWFVAGAVSTVMSCAGHWKPVRCALRYLMTPTSMDYLTRTTRC